MKRRRPVPVHVHRHKLERRKLSAGLGSHHGTTAPILWPRLKQHQLRRTSGLSNIKQNETRRKKYVDWVEGNQKLATTVAATAVAAVKT